MTLPMTPTSATPSSSRSHLDGVASSSPGRRAVSGGDAPSSSMDLDSNESERADIPVPEPRRRSPEPSTPSTTGAKGTAASNSSDSSVPGGLPTPKSPWKGRPEIIHPTTSPDDLLELEYPQPSAIELDAEVDTLGELNMDAEGVAVSNSVLVKSATWDSGRVSRVFQLYMCSVLP